MLIRPATPEDEPFLERLFFETHPSLAHLPLYLRDILAPMQYRGRRMTYASSYPDAEDSILCFADGAPAGRQLIAPSQGVLRLVDIAVLPWGQRRGVATKALQRLLKRAEDEHCIVQLTVARGNPAERLYRRLGFAEAAADEMDFHLVWTAQRTVERDT